MNGRRCGVVHHCPDREALSVRRYHVLLAIAALLQAAARDARLEERRHLRAAASRHLHALARPREGLRPHLEAAR